MKNEWFDEWFDSPYYHLLYNTHDESDAQTAIDNLLTVLDLPAGARILDLACGKGRHSRRLASKGFNVTGLDISTSSIAYARRFENENLSFYQHDMRIPFRINYFDAVMNMFTSFGYFADDDDHQKSISNVGRGLRRGGRLILDYFNTEKVKRELRPSDVKTVEGIEFHLTRFIKDEYVYKDIEFYAGRRRFHFQEKVRLFTESDFRALFAEAGLETVAVFGDYNLAPYSADTGQRMILLARKA